MLTFLLVAAALLPAIVLCCYIYAKDRVEKEPIGLLLRLLIAGAVCCLPAALIEGVILGAIDKFFAQFITQSADGTLLIAKEVYVIYQFLKNFIGIALVEEGLKFLALFLITKNNKEFNSLFDGLIYAIFVSLGFAALENILYVTSNGFGNAAMRAVTSIPGHMFFAVLMGYYYSLWHISEKAGALESDLKGKGILHPTTPSITYGRFVALSLIMPVAVHGFYDYCCTYGSGLAILVFYIFLIGMYIYCFGKIRKMSNSDAPVTGYAAAIVVKRFPQLRPYFFGETPANAEPVENEQTNTEISEENQEIN